MIEPAEQRDGGAWCTMVDEGGFEGIRQVASGSGPGSGQGAGAAHMPAGTFKSGASSSRNHFAQFNHKDGESVTGRDPSKGKDQRNGKRDSSNCGT